MVLRTGLLVEISGKAEITYSGRIALRNALNRVTTHGEEQLITLPLFLARCRDANAILTAIYGN